MVDLIDKWDSFKETLINDLEIWKMTIGEVESRRTLSVDLQERAEMQGILGTLSIYVEMLEYYLELMEGLEQGEDGGTETTDT